MSHITYMLIRSAVESCDLTDSLFADDATSFTQELEFEI